MREYNIPIAPHDSNHCGFFQRDTERREAAEDDNGQAGKIKAYDMREIKFRGKRVNNGE